MHKRMAAAVGLVLAGALAGPARADEWAQIAALQKVKASLTPAERKLDSQLAVRLKAPQLAVGVTSAPQVEVDIRGKVPVARLRGLGARIEAVAKGSVRAVVPVAGLEAIARRPEVERVDEAVGALTATMPSPGWMSPEDALRELAAPVVSEGVAAHAADVARSRRHVSGIGVKVCALSDGVDSLADSQASGDLPPAVDVLPGAEGRGDEGTAMLEIVHDMAPGAALGFATADDGAASFAENIRALRFTAHCDVIVDDYLYFAESPFEDGPIAQAVNAVTADGALYFSSAGNEGNTLDGTAGNYERDFAGSGRSVGKFAGEAHDFDPGPDVQLFEPISDESSAGVPVTLWWADRLGAAADDYDLYLFDAAGNVVSFSQDVQDGDDDPWELLGTPSFGASGLKLAVVRYSGAARYLQLSALRSRFSASGTLKAFVTPGVTRGHSAAAAAFSIAAAPAADPYPVDLESGDPPNPAGPFPKAFRANQRPERFTSDGPRRMFFPAPVVRQKPDFTAADGVSTSFGTFFGTSAAAPHAAAIAALVLSGNPGMGEAEVRQAFDATALDLPPAGVDGRTGHGILRADRVLDYTGATPQPLVKAGPPAVTDGAGDGDGFLEPGETGTVTLPVTNVGDGTATGINVTLTTDDPQATVTPPSRSYGNLRAGATRSRDFTVKLAPSYPNGKPFNLAARVTFAGRLSPTAASFRVPIGHPAAAPVTFAYTGPPLAIPDNDDEHPATVSFAVDLPGYAAAVAFSIDGTACTTTEGATTVGIDHTYVADLVATLTSPSGRSVTLFEDAGAGGNNLCRVVFDDAAEEPFSDVTSTDAPFSGTWRPEQPLAGLLAAPVTGTWTLAVVDTAPNDTGSIRAVSLHITGYEP